LEQSGIRPRALIRPSRSSNRWASPSGAEKCLATGSMMPVEARADAAVMVDWSATERAGRPAGADHGRRMRRQGLHLRQVRFEMAGGGLGAFLDQFDQRNF